MDSRPILLKKEKLKILIDSRSFDELLYNGDTNARTLLKYSTSEPFEFLRSPFETTDKELKEIPTFIYDKNENNIPIIKIIRDEYKRVVHFGYQMRDIEEIGKVVFNKNSLSDKERETILLPFVQAAFGDIDILVTNNKNLLKKRLRLESRFPKGTVNIATIEEAKEIMDLFLKYQGKYYISSNYTCNKGLWYWLSFRSKVPTFHVGDPFLDALSTRFVYLLMSVDEMGFQYYSGVNNDTMNDMLYHFNYFISLVTGIFDSLALRTKNQYKLKFYGDRIPSRTSLHNKAGRNFLRAVRGKNLELRKHINNHVNFIKLIYKLREVVIHREMPEKTSFEEQGISEGWEMNFIEVDENIASLIRSCGDKNQKYEPVTEWGVYTLKTPPKTQYLVEPFHFAKSATKILIEFTNKYLELLGFEDFIKELKSKNPNDEFVKMLEIFNRDRLGF